MIAHDYSFTERLNRFAQLRREIYARGYAHGVLSALGIVGFFAFYFWSAA